MTRPAARAVLALALLAALALPSQAPAAVPAVEELRLGVLTYDGNDAAERTWRPTRSFLEHALPGYRIVLSYHDLEGLRDAAAGRRVDFVLTNPGQYVELELQHGASRIATLAQQAQDGDGLGVGSAVVARADRTDLVRLEDMRGQVLAATTARGFGAYQIVWRELAALGIDPETDLARTNFVGVPMRRVLDAVARGDADVGIVRACLLESMPDWRRRFKVLAPRPDGGFGCARSTRLYPDWPLARLPHARPEAARALAIALLQMPAAADGVHWNVPADYQSVHALFRELRIGPYAHLREQGLAGLLARYWWVLLALALGLLGWLAYTVRVEQLVQARTAALRTALREREALAARIRATQEQVDHMSRLTILGELATTLAHELSQPLAGIANYGHSLLRRLDNGRLDDAAVRQAAGEIARQADAAAAVLGRIRAFARKRASIRETRALAPLVHESVALFRGMLAQAPHIAVDDRLAPGTRVEVDALQIQQVLLNLFKNGSDAMRAVAHDARRIDVVLERRAREIVVAVRDHGCGVTPDQRARLFEPFYTTREDGLGLGLSICCSIAEAHGGKLEAFEPSQGNGMQFCLALPAYD